MKCYYFAMNTMFIASFVVMCRVGSQEPFSVCSVVTINSGL